LQRKEFKVNLELALGQLFGTAFGTAFGKIFIDFERFLLLSFPQSLTGRQKKQKPKQTTHRNCLERRPHKNFAGFQRRIPARGIVSNTEARAGLCGGAACIAWGIRPVENKKFLCSLDLLVLLNQAKSTEYLKEKSLTENPFSGLIRV